MAPKKGVTYYNVADAIHAITTGHAQVSLNTEEQFLDQLLRALKDNSTLTALGLGQTFLTPPEVRPLIKGLPDATGLTVLDLTTCFHGGNTVECVRRLAEALQDNATLARLDLRQNDIDDQGAHFLASALEVNATLKYIHLQRNNIGARGAALFAKALTPNVTLQSIHLNDNQTGFAGATALADALKVNSTLSDLDLERNEVGDEGAVALAEALKVNTSLISMKLRANRVGDRGAIALAEALKINQTLEQLNLANNSITDHGVVALAQAIATHPHLDLLDLRFLNISDASVQAFVVALQDNRVLTNLSLDAMLPFDGMLQGREIIRTLMERNKAFAIRKVVLTVNLEGDQLVFRKMNGEQVATFNTAEVRDTSVKSLCQNVAGQMTVPLSQLAFAGASGIRIDAESLSTVGDSLREWRA